jgi:hypothetical protein
MKARHFEQSCAMTRLSEFNESLARNATHTHARATEASRAIALNQHHFSPELRGTQRCRVAAGTAAHHQEINPLGHLANNHQTNSARSS